MKTKDEIAAAIKAIEQEMRNMLDGRTDPYAAGWKIWSLALANAVDSPTIMHPFWLIWGSLTDWVENRPKEKAKAESEMLRASREWLSLDRSDSKATTAYLDRWVYEEMGYKREEKKQPEPTAAASPPMGQSKGAGQ